MDASEFAIRYHDATKHHFQRAARGPGQLDWASQPDPFRRFAGTENVVLPLIEEDLSPPFRDLLSADLLHQPVTLDNIAALLQFAFGLSAWKAFQNTRWALRCNPSSGNLHPTETYLLTGGAGGLAGGVYHYAPKAHALECRSRFDAELWIRLTRGMPEGVMFVGLSSIHWREAWKYGERAYRYCQHDVGHALAACAYSAAALGWSVRWCEGLADRDVAALLGLDRADDFADAEAEHPDLLLAVAPCRLNAPRPPCPDSEAVGIAAAGPWRGAANRLSRSQVKWELIDAVADACVKLSTDPSENPGAPVIPELSTAASPTSPLSAWAAFRQRRSAVAMDGVTTMSREAWLQMLRAVMPGANHTLADGLDGKTHIHLLLFVHRVVGVPPGLYLLARDRNAGSQLRQACRGDLTWSPVPNQPDELPLYLLHEGDTRSLAGTLSCQQAIAADGTFSVGMLAEFEAPLRQHGAWYYRRLFWEAGMIGQVLYLEAEAAGLRGTGIGCYFDDPVHDVLGLQDHAYQSLYHFTIGGPVEDTRLTTLPPYEDRTL